MAEIDFIADEDEEESPKSEIDFTADPLPVVARPRPIIPPPDEPHYLSEAEQEAIFQQAVADPRNQTLRVPTLRERIRNSEPMRRLLGPTAIEREAMAGSTGSPGEIAEAILKFTGTAPPPIAEAIRSATEPLISAIPNQTARGVARGGRELAMSLPGMIASGQILPSNPAVLAAFGGQAVWNLPEQKEAFERARKSGDEAEAAQIATEAFGMGALLTAGAAHGAATSRRAPVTLPESMRELVKEPSTTGEPSAVPERQATEAVRGLPEQPRVNEPLPAEKGGGEVPQRTIPPGDAQGAPRAAETRAAEVPLAEVPKVLLTPTVRIGEQLFKGKAHPLAIGEASKKLAADAPIEELFKPESQGFTAIDPATGKERFVSRKEAAEIFEKQTGKKTATPDKLTSEDLRDAGLLGHLDETAAAAPVAVTKPEVVRHGNSRFKNPLGDPLGTRYRATPEDWSRWQAVKSELDKSISEGRDITSPEVAPLVKENESIKNKYGGMPPEPPARKGGEPVETQIPKASGQEVLDQGKAVAEPALGEATAVPTEAVKSLPPIPAGHVRLFHGEGGPQGGGTGGAFYTSNIAKASTFGPDISWVDLPNATAQVAFVKAKASAFAGGDNFILEPTDIQRSKKIGQKVEPPTHVLDEPAAAQPSTTPRGIAASVRGPGGLRGQSEAGAVSLAPVQAAVDAFKTKALQQLPKLKDVSREPLPDLGKREDNKKIATEPTGFGRTPALGWLLDPRQKANLPHEKAILTWFYEKAMGDAHVQALASTFGTRFKKLFPRNDTGELSNVGITQPGQSRHPSDVFEGLQRDPNSYVLTTEQRTGFNDLMQYEQKLRNLAKKYKIRFDEETGDFVEGAEGQTPYWTRGRTIKRGAEKRAVGGTMIGARQYFQKGRTFKTEAEGVAKGFEYPLNVEDRLIMRAERLYKAITDRRLAQDKDIGGRWGGTPTYEEAQVFQPAFRREFTMKTPEGPQHVSQSKIFPIKTANALNKAFGNQLSKIRKSVASANNFLKSMTLGFDFGVGQIQLLGTAYKNPGIWGTANWTAMKAFLSRDVFAKYAERNAGPIRELAQYGSGVGRLPEMMAGLESGELMTAGPRALGKAIERTGAKRTGKAVAATAEVPAAFARQFQTFMDVAKVELWKARREVVPREEWAREVQAIESQLLSTNMERIGVTPNRALVERILLLAPSYYRGALNQIGGLAAKGASGETYRRAMGAYMLGTTATFVGMALAAGLSWDDIRKRLNPSRGDFMMVPVKTGKRTIEVGFGGIMRSFMRLSGEIVETSAEHPGNWKSLAPEKNPITRWLRGHAAPVPARAWDAFSGKDYMGEEADLASLGKGTLPLAAQQLFGEKTPRTPGGIALETATQFLGGSSFPGKTAKQKAGSMYREWLEKQTDPKIKADIKRREGMVLPEGKYKALDDALSIRDESAAIKAIAALKAEGQKNNDILERMRPYTGEGINSLTKSLFHGEPPRFKASLKPYEREEYQKALAERKATYQEFLKVWRKRDAAPKTGLEIDFVPDAGQ